MDVLSTPAPLAENDASFLGTYPAVRLSAAKDEALALAVAVKAGRDPLLERRVQSAAETFATLADRYIADHRQRRLKAGRRTASTDEAERLLNASILPLLGHHRAEAVTRRHVMAAVEAVAARGSFVMADHVLGLIPRDLQLGQRRRLAGGEPDTRT